MYFSIFLLQLANVKLVNLIVQFCILYISYRKRVNDYCSTNA